MVSLKPCDCYPDQSDESKDKRDKRSVDLLVDFIKERDEILESLRMRSSELNCPQVVYLGPLYQAFWN